MKLELPSTINELVYLDLTEALEHAVGAHEVIIKMRRDGQFISVRANWLKDIIILEDRKSSMTFEINNDKLNDTLQKEIKETIYMTKRAHFTDIVINDSSLFEADWIKNLNVTG